MKGTGYYKWSAGNLALIDSLNIPSRRSQTVLLLLEECLDLLQTFFIFRDIKIFLDDSNKHVQNNDFRMLGCGIYTYQEL